MKIVRLMRFRCSRLEGVTMLMSDKERGEGMVLVTYRYVLLFDRANLYTAANMMS